MRIELKLKPYSAKEIAKITGGELKIFGGDPEKKARFLSTDSRDGGEGVMFCAIKGERVDGNDFIPNALDDGSDLFLCQFVPEKAQESGKPFCALLVDDTIDALGKLAADYRKHSRAKFVGITGSVGKTTTKEFISAVASAAFRTHKTGGNYNNLLGLPLTVFGIAPDDEVVVLEMGMSNLGEIERMSQIACPDIAVITNVGTSHLESLGSRENICRAKMEIRAGLKENGTLLLNGDDPYLTAAAEVLEKKPMFFSQHAATADFRAVNVRQKDESIEFDLLYGGKAVTNVEIPVLGKHNVNNALAGYAVGTLLGMTDDQIRAGLDAFVGVDKRQKIYQVGGLTVIDDCYNASPESMRAGIEVLVSMANKKGARPAALLGDMLELGKDSRIMHDQLGQFAAQKQVQKLFCYGRMADAIAEAAIKNGIRAENVFVCLDASTPEVMAEMIEGSLSDGDILLVKASRGVKAENVIECLKKPKRKRKSAKE